MAHYAVSDRALSSVAEAIRTRRGSEEALSFPDGFISGIAAIRDPVIKPKDVNFYDADGTILYSYTAEEFAALSETPEPPSHEGLISQGWNWSLADAKAQAALCGTLTIGQTYATDDGRTRIHIHLEKGRLSPTLRLGVNGSVSVDWGDGSAAGTLSGSSLSAAQSLEHTYASPGDYVIALRVTGSAQALGDNTRGCRLLGKANDVTAENRAYQNAIRRLEIGSDFILGNHAFNYCHFLSCVTIPKGVLSLPLYAFYRCPSLAFITLPDGMTSVGGYAFQYGYSLRGAALPKTLESLGNYALAGCTLRSLTLPDGLETLGSSAFNDCGYLTHLKVPDGVTSIASNTFYACKSLLKIVLGENVGSIGATSFASCGSLAELHFRSVQPPTISNANAWVNVATDCKIFVPAGSLSAYTSATNYPDSNTFTYVEE